MIIETSNVTRTKSMFRVEELQGTEIAVLIRAKVVEEIVDKVPEVEENDVAVLLGVIEEARMSSGKMKYTKILAEDVQKGIVALLQDYSIENLISIFEEMKYFEIEQILKSDFPSKVLQEFM